MVFEQLPAPLLPVMEFIMIHPQIVLIEAGSTIFDLGGLSSIISVVEASSKRLIGQVKSGRLPFAPTNLIRFIGEQKI